MNGLGMNRRGINKPGMNRKGMNTGEWTGWDVPIVLQGWTHREWTEQAGDELTIGDEQTVIEPYKGRCK